MVTAIIDQFVEVTNTKEYETELLLIDNGSDFPHDYPFVKIARNEKSTGVYPTFEQGFKATIGDIVAFFHSDVAVWEPNWNQRVIDLFRTNDNLGLLGFIGSNEIDQAGGRGLGTSSNFMGRTLDGDGQSWTGSPAEPHGARHTDYKKGAVVDGCVMIIRRDAWEDIGIKDKFPPHHFYDKLISSQMLEKGWEVGTLGIEFDHFSGQTVNTQKGYQTMAHDWLYRNGHMPGEFNPDHNYDEDIYKLSEAMWLNEYRDTKHVIPIKI